MKAKRKIPHENYALKGVKNMGKVFMSCLGASRYLEARYELDGKISPLTPFVQEALLYLLRTRWTEEDRLVFFLTHEARKANWEDGGNFPEGLNTRLKKLHLPAEIMDVDFREAKSEAEIDDDFLIVFNSLKEGDEVFLDITHSFRSLPMLSLVALSYARAMKNVEIRAIYYGALEARGSVRELREVPPEERVVPVFNLTRYAHLLDWSFAVEEFTKYGQTKRLMELVRKDTVPVLKESGGRDDTAIALGYIASFLSSMSQNIHTCRCREIENLRLKPHYFEQIKEESISPPFIALVRKLRDELRRFDTRDPWEKALAAVAWCLKHSLIQQGYTILQEAVITEVCRLLNYTEEELLCEKHRGHVSSLLKLYADKQAAPEELFGEEGHQQLDEKERAAFRTLVEKGGEPLVRVAEVFRNLLNLRNDLNHCGWRSTPARVHKLETKLSDFSKDLEDAVPQLRSRMKKEN